LIDSFCPYTVIERSQLVHVDSMAAPLKPQLDAVMDQAFTTKPLADTRAAQQIDGALFQHAGAHRSSAYRRERFSTTTFSMPSR